MRGDSEGLALAFTTGQGPAVSVAASPDLSDDLEVARSFAPRAWIGAGFILTFVSSSLAFGWWGEVGNLEMVTGYGGMILFGVATCRLIWMLPERGPVVIVSRYGIRDLRIGNDFLLWDAIEEVSTGEHRGHKVVMLKLTPALQRQRCGIKSGRKMPFRRGEASADHIVVSPEGLTTSFDTLLQACQAFHAASERRTALQHSDP